MKAWKACAMSGLSYSHSQIWMIQTSCGIMRCFFVLLCSNFPEKQSVFWRMVGTGIFFSLHWWLYQIDAFTVVQCRSFSPEESCSLIWAWFLPRYFFLHFYQLMKFGFLCLLCLALLGALNIQQYYWFDCTNAIGMRTILELNWTIMTLLSSPL